MRRIANKLNNAIVTCSQIMSAGGRYDWKAGCYRFPDGSAGKLIMLRRRGKNSPEQHLKFIEMKVTVEDISRRAFARSAISH